MPTIQRFHRCKLDMYSREHGVPHFHLIASSGERAAFAIGTQVLLAGSIGPRDSRDALEWARQNADALGKKWKELNP